MSTNKVCDVCLDAAKQPVFAVRVGIEVLGAVDGSQSSGCVHEVEACEGCWPKAMGDLAENVKTQLTRDIPIHRQVYLVNAEIATLQLALTAAVRQRDELNPDSPKFKAAQREVDKCAEALRAREDARLQLLASAQ